MFIWLETSFDKTPEKIFQTIPVASTLWWEKTSNFHTIQSSNSYKKARRVIENWCIMHLFASHFYHHILEAAKQMVIELMSPFAHSRLFVIYSWKTKQGALPNAVYIIHPLFHTIQIGTSFSYSFKQLHSNLDVKGRRGVAFDWVRITWQGQVRRNSVQCNPRDSACSMQRISS